MSNGNNVSDDVWRKKDDLSARQTAANVTGYIFEGKGDVIDSTSFLEYAEKIRAWLFVNQDPMPDAKRKSVESKTLPTPTLAQKKVLDAIKEKIQQLGIEQDVLDWAEEVHKVRKYPESVKSVEAFIKWHNERAKDEKSSD